MQTSNNENHLTLTLKPTELNSGNTLSPTKTIIQKHLTMRRDNTAGFKKAASSRFESANTKEMDSTEWQIPFSPLFSFF